MFDETKLRLYKNDICAFISDQYHIKPKESIQLWDFQKDILYKATSKKKDGMFEHKTFIFFMPRQYSRSELSCIIGLHSLFLYKTYGYEILSMGIGGMDTARRLN